MAHNHQCGIANIVIIVVVRQAIDSSSNQYLIAIRKGKYLYGSHFAVGARHDSTGISGITKETSLPLSSRTLEDVQTFIPCLM